MQENKIKEENQDEPSNPYIKEMVDFNLESNRSGNRFEDYTA